MIARGEEGVCEKGEDGQKVQTFSNKINKSWDVMYSSVTSINSTVSKKDLKKYSSQEKEICNCMVMHVN